MSKIHLFKKLLIKFLFRTLKAKECEYAAYFSVLMEQNMKLKNNFKNYDNNKDKIYQKWIEDVKHKHDKEVEK